MDALTGICLASQTLSNFQLNLETVEIIAEASIAICSLLPQDLPDDSPRSLRQILVLLFDQIDPCNPYMPKEKFFEIRMKMAMEAMQKHAQYPASREVQNYAAAIVCSVISGDPPLISLPIYSFILSILPSDDTLVRDCIIQLFPSMLENLIPRVPRPKGIEVQNVTPENYDQVEFKDRAILNQSKMQPYFLSKEQFLSEEVVKKFYPNDYAERVKILWMMRQ